MKMKDAKLVYVADSPLSGCTWRCTVCEYTFHGSGEAIHRRTSSCYGTGYEECELLVPPAAIEKVQHRAAEKGDDDTSTIHALSLAQLRAAFPELKL